MIRNYRRFLAPPSSPAGPAAVCRGRVFCARVVRLASELERQRQLFADVIPSVERGDWSAVEKLPAADKHRLQQYVLWPDLRAAYLQKRLAEVPVAEMDAFLAEYGSLRPARTLRYKLALHLAKSGELAAYHRLYERFYQGQNIAKLDCLALQAELEAGRQSRVNARAKALWLVGTSQVRECDPVFDYLEAQQLLGRDDYRTRFGLADRGPRVSAGALAGKKARPATSRHRRELDQSPGTPGRIPGPMAGRRAPKLRPSNWFTPPNVSPIATPNVRWQPGNG